MKTIKLTEIPMNSAVSWYSNDSAIRSSEIFYL